MAGTRGTAERRFEGNVSPRNGTRRDLMDGYRSH